MNAIIIQIETQKTLLIEIKKLVDSEQFKEVFTQKPELYETLKNMIEPFEISLEIQDSSAEMMSFIV
jgi:hypothetical protein